MMDEAVFAHCVGFEWDEGNNTKNWDKHNVSMAECEQVFFNIPIVVAEDIKHSDDEKRYYILGRTDFNRLLFVVMTIRKKYIRVISARDMNRKEKQVYHDKATQ